MGGELKNRKQLSTNIDKEIFERLKRYSDNTMIPMTKIIDKAIDEYLQKQQSKKHKQ